MGIQIHPWAQIPGPVEEVKSTVKLQRSIKASAFSDIDHLIKKIVVGDGSLPSRQISRSAVSKLQGFVYQN